MTRAHIALLILALLAFLGITAAWAGSSTHYGLNWWVTSGGGGPGRSGSGQLDLNGSLGQTAIGTSAIAGGGVVLQAGYWSTSGQKEARVYLPIVSRGNP